MRLVPRTVLRRLPEPMRLRLHLRRLERSATKIERAVGQLPPGLRREVRGPLNAQLEGIKEIRSLAAQLSKQEPGISIPEARGHMFIVLWDASVGRTALPAPNGFALALECRHPVPPPPPEVVTGLVSHIYCDECGGLRRFDLIEAMTDDPLSASQ
jgi:hypothetical protein